MVASTLQFSFWQLVQDHADLFEAGKSIQPAEMIKIEDRWEGGELQSNSNSTTCFSVGNGGKMSPSMAPKAEHGKQSFTQEQLLVDEEKQNGEGEVGDNGVRLT